MSYDLCEFEECFFTHPFSPLSDSSSNDILKSFQESNYNLNTLIHNIHETPLDEIDHIAPAAAATTTRSSSPPCSQLQSLSAYQMGNSVNSKDLCHFEIKTEESQLPFYDSYMDINSFMPHSYGGCDNSAKMMQRRACSTGDLHSLETSKTLSSSPLGTEGLLMEEANFKVGRYNPEERKERILRYKEKRTQKNFNKTIKYACRKTLADNRPRIRGRFARNDESQATSKALTFQRYVNEEELWMEGLQ
ncbi:uncharacterized protein LOC143623520 [Bidens hawaiensis]|uniref:uncharacterized protein LOC143623520 n=1 Tax=Bidens hawaiensis TaxID=980011 RepID=UPI00404A9D9F